MNLIQANTFTLRAASLHPHLDQTVHNQQFYDPLRQKLLFRMKKRPTTQNSHSRSVVQPLTKCSQDARLSCTIKGAKFSTCRIWV